MRTCIFLSTYCFKDTKFLLLVKAYQVSQTVDYKHMCTVREFFRSGKYGL